MKSINLNKVFPYLLAVFGAWGVTASLILSHDTFAVAQNHNFIPSCNLNPVLSCGTVINATGDKIFGIPYPFYGIALFAILAGLGVALLAGAKFKDWYWRLYILLLFLGTLGAYGLLLKSIYKIHALCPFCLSVDFVTTIVFWYSLLYVIGNGYLSFKWQLGNKIYTWARKHHLDIIVFWFLLLFVLIMKHFWYYYGKHL